MKRNVIINTCLFLIMFVLLYSFGKRIDRIDKQIKKSLKDMELIENKVNNNYNIVDSIDLNKLSIDCFNKYLTKLEKTSNIIKNTQYRQLKLMKDINKLKSKPSFDAKFLNIEDRLDMVEGETFNYYLIK